MSCLNERVYCIFGSGQKILHFLIVKLIKVGYINGKIRRRKTHKHPKSNYLKYGNVTWLYINPRQLPMGNVSFLPGFFPTLISDGVLVYRGKANAFAGII